MKHSSASAAALDAGNVVGYNRDKIIRLRPHSDKANAGSSEKRSLVNGFGPKGETGKGDEGGAGEQPLFALNAAEFVSAFGIGLLFALLQASLGGYVLFAAFPMAGFVLDWAAELAGPLTFGITIVVCWRFSDWIDASNRGIVFVAGSAVLVALSVFLCLASIYSLDMPPVLITSEALGGMAFALVLILWVIDIWAFHRSAAVRVMLVALCIAGACTALLSIIPTPAFRYIAIAVCVVLSGFCYMVGSQSIDADEAVSREETKNNIKFDMRTSVSLFITAIALGVCSYMVAGFGETGLIICGVSFFVAAIAFCADVLLFGEKGVVLGALLRWSAPVLTICFVAMPFVGDVVLCICNTVVLAVCNMCLMSLIVTLVQVKFRFSVQPVCVWSRVFIPWAWGAFAGMLLACAELACAETMGVMAHTMALLLMPVLFSISTALTPYGSDFLTLLLNPHDDSKEDGDDPQMVHAWKSACNRLAHEGGLTPRETDVFMLLAKGRNARVIERELVISVYTIKGHNNNIYRKLGVKSQQELIDLVERYRQEIWESKMEDEQGGEHG